MIRSKRIKKKQIRHFFIGEHKLIQWQSPKEIQSSSLKKEFIIRNSLLLKTGRSS